MTYTAPYVYFTIGGHFGATAGLGVEQWQVGFKLRQPTGTPTGTQLQAFLESIHTDVVTFHGESNVSAGNVCIYDRLTAALIGTDGKYVGGSLQDTTERPAGTNVPGAGVATMPFQIACTYTMLTSVGRGPGSHGRFYYPCLSRTWDGLTGQWNATLTGGAATAATTLVKAINTKAASNIPGNTGVWVMSNVGLSASVTHIEVGRVPDTQRRRRRNLVENKQPSVTPVLAAAAALAGQPIGSQDVSELVDYR